MAGETEKRLAELGVTLAAPAAPAANYVSAVQSGNMLYLSGQLPRDAAGLQYVGKLGRDMSIEDAQKAARICAINLLAAAKAAVGDLDKVKRVVKVVGFVNSAPDFGDQPKVVNGASDFLVDALGERGRHARSAIGVGALPFGASVEVEAVLEIG